jgi:hypothetical protein
MKHYDYQVQLKEIWTQAVALYTEGRRNSNTYFNEEKRDFLQSIGVSAQEVYDFAEDFVTAGEPDFTTFALVHDIRRSYFTEVENGQSTQKAVEASSYPEPSASGNGIPYLPRITEKARTKLTGELNPDIMYNCSNDRRFLKTHDIHPAEFLRKVWDTDADLDQLSSWIYNRSDVALKAS